MIVDTSAVMAILLREPELDEFIRTLNIAPSRSMSAGSWIELTIVIERRRDPALFTVRDKLLQVMPITVLPVSVEQARIGADAYRKYGRGNHPARLNFGDCFAYALAKETGEPLLFKGDDFIHTDIRAA